MSSLALVSAVAPMDGPEERSRVIESAKAGDLAAFEQLIRQHERLVLITALRLLGRLEDAQDASQEVFLRLYRHLSRVEAATLAPWLYRVTVNVCHDMRRKRSAAAGIDDMPELATSDPDPQRLTADAERRRALDLSLRMLPEKERAALVLRDLEGLSTREVARVLGSSEATVRSQVSKARVKIRGFLERYFRRRI